MIKTNFTKIGLSKLEPGIDLERQYTSLECDMVEEQYTEAGDFIRAIEKKIKLRNQWCHIDLLNLFSALRPHLALICEIANASPDFEDPNCTLDIDEISPGIYAKSVIITGSNENLRVSIIGFKTLSFDNQLDLRTPAIPLDGDYPFVGQLMDIISGLESEARLAIYEQKGCGAQLDLFADSDGEEPGQSKQKKAKRKNIGEDFANSLEEAGVTAEFSMS